MATVTDAIAATSKMATATSKMAPTTTFKAATYHSDMPLEMAEDLPPSAGMIIQLLKNVRVDLKNDLKKDFDIIYGALDGINQRTKVEKLYHQDQSHLELVDTVRELQKQVAQQAEKLEDAEERSRHNNLRIRGIHDSVDVKDLANYFVATLPTAKEYDLLLDHIHRLPKPSNALAAPNKDVIVRFHYIHIKEEFLGAVCMSSLPGDYNNVKVFQDFSSYTMRRRREFQHFTAELRQRGICYRWVFPVKVLFRMDGKSFSVTSPEEGAEVLRSITRRPAPQHMLTPLTSVQPSKRSKTDAP
ncbi:LOW QUALITY PROTEIN: uncharacterized protein RCH25_049246 [Pelodytes ibericus]